MSNNIEKSFEVSLNTLRFVGLYPLKNKRNCLHKIQGVVCYVVFSLVFCLSLLAKILLGEDSGLVEANIHTINFSGTLMITVKLIPLIIKGPQVEKCVNYFAHPFFKPRHEEEKITNHCVYVCQRSTKIYFYMLVSGAIMCFLLPAIIMSKNYKLPMELWLPYKMDRPSTYYPTFLYYVTGFTKNVIFLILNIVAAAFYNCLSGSMIDPLLAGMMYHTISQFKILKHNLQNLGSTDLYIKFEDVFENLKRSVILHNKILTFVRDFEECFSVLIFTQFGTNTFALCFALFGFSAGSSDALQTLLYVFASVVILFQLWISCYFGTLLSEENDSLINSICEGPWYRYDVRTRKTLIFIMEKTKQPVMVSAGKVIPLNLETFLSLMKLSYTMLTAVNTVRST